MDQIGPAPPSMRSRAVPPLHPHMQAVGWAPPLLPGVVRVTGAYVAIRSLARLSGRSLRIRYTGSSAFDGTLVEWGRAVHGRLSWGACLALISMSIVIIVFLKA